MRQAVLLLLCLLLVGCGTFLQTDPTPYGGVQWDLKIMGDSLEGDVPPVMFLVGFFDFPISLVFDTMLLPVSLGYTATPVRADNDSGGTRPPG